MYANPHMFDMFVSKIIECCGYIPIVVSETLEEDHVLFAFRKRMLARTIQLHSPLSVSLTHNISPIDSGPLFDIFGSYMLRPELNQN